jgi:hypothetical protein
MDGYGEFSWKDGNKYFGYYVSDKKEGFGVFYWPNAEKIFVGFWKNGKQEGVGIKLARGKIKYSLWKAGKIFKDYDSLEIALNQMTKEQLAYSKFFDYQMEELLEFFK